MMAGALFADAGGSKKLSITSCSMDGSGSIKADGSTFEVMMNPSQYSRQRNISYSGEASYGSTGKRPHFDKFEPETITLHELVIDGTGAVPSTTASGVTPSVMDQIESLTRIIYVSSGTSTAPPWIKLLWGTLIFYGRLKSMKINYTLFKPSGEPLRAKVDLDFIGALSPQEEALRGASASLNLSQNVKVIAGDTLPMLCYQVYSDSSYYLAVALANNLTNFRSLVPGSILYFPPLM